MRRRCGIDADDAQQQLLALFDDLLRMRDPLVGQLGDVNQTLDAILDAGKRAEVGQLSDRAADQLADLVAWRPPGSMARPGCA